MNSIVRTFLALPLLAPLAPLARGDFTVTGNLQYVDKVFTYSNGWTGSQPNLPIRKATVQVIDNTTSAVLATGATDTSGNISIPVVASGTKNIVVRCFSRSNQFGANALQVVGAGSVEYSVSSAVFSNWNTSTNLNAGNVVALKITSGSSQANPFNMLDQGVAALDYVKSLGAGNPTQTVRYVWPGGGGSFASGNTANLADDDGYDDMVQLHELGHVLHNLYSDSDTTGGSHTFGESDQDPRLSFGEGWASFFGGAVRKYQGLFDPGFYMDCSGSSTTGGVQLKMRLETGSPYNGSTGGEADEGAVFCCLWDVVDAKTTNDGDAVDDDQLDGTITFSGGISGDQMQWNVFTGPVKSAANSTIRDEWNGFYAPTNYGNYSQLDAAFNVWKMRFHGDTNEPNGSAATASSLALSSTWSATKALYYSAANPPAPGDGDSDYYSFSLALAAVFEVETRYPNAAGDAETYCDTFLVVRRPNGTTLAQSDSGGTGRNAKLTNLVADVAGVWTAEVKTVHSYRKTGSYQVRARLLSGGGTPPNVTAVSPSSVNAVELGAAIVTLSGSALSSVSSVLVDGVSNGFSIVSDAQIDLAMPMLAKLGAVDITVVSPAGADSIQVLIQANDPPLIRLEGTPFLSTSFPAVLTIGSEPGDVAFVVVSLELLPTLIPGLVSLDVGNNLSSLIYLGAPLLPAQAWLQKSYSLAGVSPLTTLYFQVAVYKPLLGFPLVSSNFVSGLVLF